MTEKPRVRVPASSVPAFTADSFQNVQQRLGLGAGGANDSAGYNFNFITRNRLMLEAAYRTSWVVGQVVDTVAEDMTKAGIVLESSLDPKSEAALYAAYRDLMIGQEFSNGVRWGRLYGGAIGLMMIDGQDASTPLDLDTIKKGQFRGIMVLDRWRALADVSDLVDDLGPDFGLPRFYRVAAGPEFGAKMLNIHYSRVVRFTGTPLPYYQRQIESLWSASVVERMWDRVVAFDSTTAGAAQLVHKAHLRTLKVKDYRQLVAAGGQMFEGFLKQVETMRMFQNIEGISVMDDGDTFETHSYTFAGLDDVLTQMGDQVCGAVEIPRVRLFGESPGGLNSDGESALRTYYDNTGKKQETHLRRPMGLVLDVLARSVLGSPPPEGFSFKFAPLWQVSDKEKSDIAKTTTEAVTTAYESNLITQKSGMQELRASSRITGVFSNISDADIDNAEDEIPDPVEIAAAMTEAAGPQADDENDPSQPGGAKPKKPAPAE